MKKQTSQTILSISGVNRKIIPISGNKSITCKNVSSYVITRPPISFAMKGTKLLPKSYNIKIEEKKTEQKKIYLFFYEDEGPSKKKKKGNSNNLAYSNKVKDESNLEESISPQAKKTANENYMYGIGDSMQEALLSTSINIAPCHSIAIDLNNLIERDGPIKKLDSNKFEGNDWIYHLDQWDEKNPYFYLVYKGTTESCKIKCNQLLVNKINKLSKN